MAIVTERSSVPARRARQKMEVSLSAGKQHPSQGSRTMSAAPPNTQQPPGYYQQGPPPKKKHTVRNVVLVLLGLGILLFAGCIALIGGAANEIDKAIKEE